MENHKTSHILLVEDHKQTARMVRHQFEKECYIVTSVFNGEQALEEAQRRRFDLIILDIGLPDVSGFDVLSRLRAESYNAPVLILSAKTDIEDRVKGLKLGADDYLIKPYDARELLARVEKILNRNKEDQKVVLQYEDVLLDVVKRKVFRADREIVLTPKEFSLLEFFLRHPSEVIPRQKLAEEVWGFKFDPGTNVVDVSVSRLRKSINDGFDRKIIATVHGEGFVLHTNF